MTRIFLIGIGVLLFVPDSCATVILVGDSIGFDNTLTNNLGGFAAVQAGGDNFGQPAVEISQDGSSLLRELRVVVHGSPSTNTAALRFDDFHYVASLWRKSNYLGGANPEFKVELGNPSNVTLISAGEKRVVPEKNYGNAAFNSGEHVPSYDFHFDLSQATLFGQSAPFFTSPLAADQWIVAFQSEHPLSSGSLLVSFSSSTTGNTAYFHKAYNGLEQHPRGILFDQEEFTFRWGIDISERTFLADFDDDNDVDGLDLLNWQRGESAIPLSTRDLAAWRQQFGAGISAVLHTSIPEPCSLSLAACCFFAATLRRIRLGA